MKIRNGFVAGLVGLASLVPAFASAQSNTARHLSNAVPHPAAVMDGSLRTAGDMTKAKYALAKEFARQEQEGHYGVLFVPADEPCVNHRPGEGVYVAHKAK